MSSFRYTLVAWGAVERFPQPLVTWGAVCEVTDAPSCRPFHAGDDCVGSVVVSAITPCGKVDRQCDVRHQLCRSSLSTSFRNCGGLSVGP
ncbi:unnamed protein product, partial [Iphiclides podalirius]